MTGVLLWGQRPCCPCRQQGTLKHHPRLPDTCVCRASFPEGIQIHTLTSLELPEPAGRAAQGGAAGCELMSASLRLTSCSHLQPYFLYRSILQSYISRKTTMRLSGMPGKCKRIWLLQRPGVKNNKYLSIFIWIAKDFRQDVKAQVGCFSICASITCKG